MFKSLRTKGGTAAALGGALLMLLLVGRAEARYPIPYTPPPEITTTPPPVTNNNTGGNPPGGGGQGCQGGDCGCHCGGTPPGGTQHLPEPATLMSSLTGITLAGLFALRRRRNALAPVE